MSDIGAATPMRVTQIEISGLRYSTAKDCHESYVSMELTPARDGAPVHLQFLCHARCPKDSASTIVVRDLIEDALRQAHRMPGFRRGERVIEVTAQATPLADRAIA